MCGRVLTNVKFFGNFQYQRNTLKKYTIYLRVKLWLVWTWKPYIFVLRPPYVVTYYYYFFFKKETESCCCQGHISMISVTILLKIRLGLLPLFYFLIVHHRWNRLIIAKWFRHFAHIFICRYLFNTKGACTNHVDKQGGGGLLRWPQHLITAI